MTCREQEFCEIELDNYKTDLLRYVAEARALHDGAWLVMRDGGDREQAKRDADEAQAILRECIASTGRLMLSWYAMAMKVEDPPEWVCDAAAGIGLPQTVERHH